MNIFFPHLVPRAFFVCLPEKSFPNPYHGWGFRARSALLLLKKPPPFSFLKNENIRPNLLSARNIKIPHLARFIANSPSPHAPRLLINSPSAPHAHFSPLSHAPIQVLSTPLAIFVSFEVISRKFALPPPFPRGFIGLCY